MTLLNYTHHTNPTSHHDIISKFRTFALARGWASDYYYNNSIQWGATGSSPPYGWISGSESHLQMSITGPGSQNIVFRMIGEHELSDAQHEYVYLTGVDPDNDTMDGNSSAQPEAASQGAYNSGYTNKFSMSPSTVPNFWIFGNDEVLIGVVEVQTGFCHSWMLGVPEFFAGSEAEDCMFAIVSQTTNAVVKWYDAFNSDYAMFYGPSDMVAGGSSYNTFWWEDAAANTLVNTTIRMTSSQVQGQGYYNDMSYAVNLNTWSGKRPLIKPTLYGQSRTSGLIRPIGNLPVYYTVFQGLAPGDTLDYGSETYMFFPHSYFYREYGWAVRIA